MQIKVKRLNPEAILPTYAYAGDAGLDLYSLEEYTLQPGERKTFPLGFALEFPFDYVAIVKDKGGLPKKVGLHTMGGVYDAGYRGEYNVNLINLDNKPHTIESGQKIAQLLIIPKISADLIEVDELSDSDRGEGCFGSSGK